MNHCTDVLVNALEALRAAIGKPINVNSAYRCMRHNAEVGGAPNSLHPRGMAADVWVKGMTPMELYEAARKVPAFGGFGVAGTFLHLDVRTTVARWMYGPDGKQRPWEAVA